MVQRVENCVQEETRAREAGSIDPAYNAAPDTTILQLHVDNGAVSKDNVIAACQGWMQGTLPAEAWSIEGDEQGK
eukprot:5599575-Karenia_brevis.AAC.1